MKNINRFIEHTNLKPTVTSKDIDVLIQEAVQYSFVGVCVPPFWVKKTKRDIQENDIQLVTVIGFPLGYNMTETKLQEMEMAISNGADELDLVMNVSSFKTGLNWAKIEMAKASKLTHEANCLLKVIIETAYLSDEEIVTAAKLASDAGVDFVKTSTGFAPGGAKVDHIKLLRKVLPSNVGIKASGGIKDSETAIAMIDAGADRIGCSASVSIVNGK
ncbi:MAG: deoxyribose-phosphate aldolase [Bacteroidota bacterium]